MKHPMEMEMEEAPSAKKQRTEDTLIPEADFLATHKVIVIVISLTGTALRPVQRCLSSEYFRAKIFYKFQP